MISEEEFQDKYIRCNLKKMGNAEALANFDNKNVKINLYQFRKAHYKRTFYFHFKCKP